MWRNHADKDSIEDDEVSPPRTAAQAGEQRPQQPGAVPALRQRRRGQLVLADAAHSPRREASSGPGEPAGQHAPGKPGAVPALRRRQPGQLSLALAPHAPQRKPRPGSSCSTSAEGVSTSGSDSDERCDLRMPQPVTRNERKEVASVVLACREQSVGGRQCRVRFTEICRHVRQIELMAAGWCST